MSLELFGYCAPLPITSNPNRRQRPDNDIALKTLGESDSTAFIQFAEKLYSQRKIILGFINRCRNVLSTEGWRNTRILQLVSKVSQPWRNLGHRMPAGFLDRPSAAGRGVMPAIVLVRRVRWGEGS